MIKAIIIFGLGYLIGALRAQTQECHNTFYLTREEAELVLNLDPPRILREDLEDFLNNGESNEL